MTSSNALLVVLVPPSLTLQLWEGSSVTPGYNQIVGQMFGDNNMRLTFVGFVEANYALGRSFNLSPPTWLPQFSNPIVMNGLLVFTNTPNLAANNFWRIRSVP
jgi:hypothetical protein